MAPLLSSAMAEHNPPLYLDSSLSYICSCSLRPSSPVLQRSDSTLNAASTLRFIFSLSQASDSQLVFCFLAVLDPSLGRASLCERFSKLALSPLPAASIHHSTNIISIIERSFRRLAIPNASRTRFSSQITLHLCPPPQGSRRDHGPHDPNSSGGDSQNHRGCSRATEGHQPDIEGEGEADAQRGRLSTYGG